MFRKPRDAPKQAALAAAPWIALALMFLMWPSRKRLVGGEPTEVQQIGSGRGRAARGPMQIPMRGWRDILRRAWTNFNADQIMTRAGAVTFFGLLALFPGVTVFVSLYGLFADVHDAQKQILALAAIAPHPAVVFLGEQMIRISVQHPSQLSLAFAFGLVISIWSANSGMLALINALNAAYGEQERRSWLRLTVHALIFTVGALIFVVFGVGAVVAFPLLLPWVRRAAAWFDVLRWPALVVLTAVALSVVYRYGPCRPHGRWRWTSVGGAVSSILWVGASVALSWWISSLGHYDRIYGPFAAVAGAMVWMWISTTIVLFGAELNAAIEHQTTGIVTTGPYTRRARAA